MSNVYDLNQSRQTVKGIDPYTTDVLTRMARREDYRWATYLEYDGKGIRFYVSTCPIDAEDRALIIDGKDVNYYQSLFSLFLANVEAEEQPAFIWQLELLELIDEQFTILGSRSSIGDEFSMVTYIVEIREGVETTLSFAIGDDVKLREFLGWIGDGEEIN